MKIGQIKRVVSIRRRKSHDEEQVTYDLCVGHAPADPVLQRFVGTAKTQVNIIREFKTRAEAEQYKKENL